MTARRLLLIRHGESTANVAATAAEAAGSETIAVEARDADIPLSQLGELQAAALGARLRDALPADVVLFSSPYRRALQTARIALGEQAPLRIDERLRDRELGVIDALTTLGVERRLPDEAARRRWVGKLYYRPPGGESWADLALRLRSFLRDLPPVETVAVFAHDAIVSVFLYVLLGMTEEELADFLLTRPVTNASVTALTRADDGRWSVDAFADDAHLAVAGLPATEHPGATRADA
jgi:broad specificity phosphatase PhoE